jgi:hypothetical protein
LKLRSPTTALKGTPEDASDGIDFFFWAVSFLENLGLLSSSGIDAGLRVSAQGVGAYSLVSMSIEPPIVTSV